jgi:hypothetical protein
MKIKSLAFAAFICPLVALFTSAPVVAGEFNCSFINSVLPTTSDIAAKIRQGLPTVIKESSSRRMRILDVKSLTSQGCNIKIKFSVQYERDNKVIKKKRKVGGRMFVEGTVRRIDGCLADPVITQLDLDNTTNVAENIVRRNYNERISSKICPDDNGVFNFKFLSVKNTPQVAALIERLLPVGSGKRVSVTVCCCSLEYGYDTSHICACSGGHQLN